jgi:Flp pilus assembly protein CpaB
VKVGDWVDVLVVYQYGERSLCRTVAQNLQVIATELVGEPPRPAEEAVPEEEPVPAEEAGPRTEPAKEKMPAPGTLNMKVVLAVDPEEAQQIAAAQHKATDVVLTIRNAMDHEGLSLEEAYEQPKDLKTVEELEKERAKALETAQRASLGEAMRGLAEMRGGEPAATPLPTTIAPVEKTVEVIRGTEREVVSVTE